MEVYSVVNRPLYNDKNKCYCKILALDREPKLPLKNISKQISFPKISPFKVNNYCCDDKNENCGYVLLNPKDLTKIANVNDLPIIFSWLFSNGYTINTSITNMLHESAVKMHNPLICIISK